LKDSNVKKEVIIQGDGHELSLLSHGSPSFDRLRTNGQKQEIDIDPFTLS
jgi:hypothetical protein